MEGLNAVIEHLKRIPATFYGQIVLRIREGKVVFLEENRTYKLDEPSEKLTRR